MPWVYKTSVSHLKFQNTFTPLKHTDGKRKFKRMLSFLLVENLRLFFTKSSFEKFEIHEIFITADRSAWAVLKRNQAAKFWKNFQVHFVLYRLACVASVSSRGSSRKLRQEQKKKKNDGRGEGERRNRLPANPTFLKNCVRPRTQLLIGAVRVVLIT